MIPSFWRRGLVGFATRAVLLVASSFVGLDCGEPSQPATHPVQTGMRSDFFAFRGDSLIITRLASPTRPVGAGRPSSANIRSDDTSIVSVTADGSLVGNRTGITMVRSLSVPNSELRVEVRQVHVLSFEPQTLDLDRSSSVPARLLADGQPLAAAAASWTTSSPAIAYVDGDWIRTGASSGEALLTAKAGEAEATLRVRTAGPIEALKIRGPSNLRVNDMRRYEVTPNFDDTKWTSERTEVLRHAGAGIFQALAIGKSEVCASALLQRQCLTIEVKQ